MSAAATPAVRWYVAVYLRNVDTPALVLMTSRDAAVASITMDHVSHYETVYVEKEAPRA